jgi:hypothetical protein
VIRNVNTVSSISEKYDQKIMSGFIWLRVGIIGNNTSSIICCELCQNLGNCRAQQKDYIRLSYLKCSVVVKELCYKPEGRGFGSRWSH